MTTGLPPTRAADVAIAATSPAATAALPLVSTALVGVFDSGLGGLSVLGALQARLPFTDVVYVADSGHAPYGDRDDDHVVRRSHRVAQYLLDQGASVLVIACNTATAVAVAEIRARWPELPIVGVEPGIKPAMQASRNGHVGVMATPTTLRSDKFVRLMRTHAGSGHLHLQPCPGLARLIEGGDLESPELIALIESHAAPLREAGVDTVVLGCTHYPFVMPQLRRVFGADVTIIDTADAVARQAAHLFASLALPASTRPGVIRLVTTGDTDVLDKVAAQWLGLAVVAEGRPDL
jgi:glutamate racemase